MTAAAADVLVAMPVGLPPAGSDATSYYAQLAPKMAAQVSSGNIVSIWVADDDTLSGAFAMCRGLMRYLPPGTAGPDGTGVATSTIVLRTTPKEYLSLRQSASPGMLLPQLVLYGNFDPAAVGTALQAEFSANSRYQSLSAQEKTQAQSDFVAGSAKLLIAVGSLIGRGAVDQSPPSAGLAGYRKIDVSFCENDGTLLDPTLYFDLWGLISGPLVQGHPLLAMLARPVTPSYAAVEGGSWIRITGTGLVAGTTITIGSSAASTIEAMSNGKTLYCVVPPGIEGGADVAVTVPGQEPTIYAGALTYVTDVVTVARALAVSLAVRLTAIRDRGSELSAANTLGDTAKTQLRLDAEEAVRGVEAIMSLRGDAGGGSLASPEIGDAWLAAASTIQPVYDEVDSMATQ